MPAIDRLSRALLCAALLAIVLPSSAWCWGGDTHRYIARNYSKHLPAAIDGLRAYDEVVESHVTDPDTRRGSTPGEAPRHFIDVDYYPEFPNAMPHSRAVLESRYGAATVLDVGIVPWAVEECVNRLAQQFQAAQWSAAVLTIADLCHYVGDATQPLHCTENFDGQYTGNNGIHSRYESSMMSSHIGELHTPVMPVAYWPNVPDAMFSIVGGSWDGLDTVLQADDDAKAASGGAYNSTYYASLWSSTQSLTRTRVDTATVATASFVYTAWRLAGMPAIPGSSGVPPTPVAANLQLGAAPSPFQNALNVTVTGTGPMTVDVFDIRGARIERLLEGASAPATVQWRPGAHVGPGVYLIHLSGPQGSLVRRVMRVP